MKVLVSHSKYVPEKEFPTDEHDVAHGHTEDVTEIIDFDSEKEFQEWLHSKGNKQKFERIVSIKLDKIPKDSKFFK